MKEQGCRMNWGGGADTAKESKHYNTENGSPLPSVRQSVARSILLQIPTKVFFGDLCYILIMNLWQVCLSTRVTRTLMSTSRSLKQNLWPLEQAAAMCPQTSPCLQIKLATLVAGAWGLPSVEWHRSFLAREANADSVPLGAVASLLRSFRWTPESSRCWRRARQAVTGPLEGLGPSHHARNSAPGNNPPPPGRSRSSERQGSPGWTLPAILPYVPEWTCRGCTVGRARIQQVQLLKVNHLLVEQGQRGVQVGRLGGQRPGLVPTAQLVLHARLLHVQPSQVPPAPLRAATRRPGQQLLRHLGGGATRPPAAPALGPRAASGASSTVSSCPPSAFHVYGPSVNVLLLI